jgi:hypothetical protein
MSAVDWVVLVAIVVVVLTALLAWAGHRTRSSSALKQRFGPEYDRVSADSPSRREAESELRERESRHEQMDIRPLEPREADRYRTRWQEVQADFVDDPAGAVSAADALIRSVMRERGYPVEDFDTRAADLSVEHPVVVENYRAAHGIAVAHERGKADTEALRTALRHYRQLFDELVGSADREMVRSQGS